MVPVSKVLLIVFSFILDTQLNFLQTALCETFFCNFFPPLKPTFPFCPCIHTSSCAPFTLLTPSSHGEPDDTSLRGTVIAVV